MGIDACIYVKTKDGKEPVFCDSLPNECALVDADVFAPDGATHEIDQNYRYYSQGYERGSWPRIAHILMMCFASENIEEIWYFGDTHNESKITRAEVNELNAHYMSVGNRPYSNKT